MSWNDTFSNYHLKDGVKSVHFDEMENDNIALITKNNNVKPVFDCQGDGQTPVRRLLGSAPRRARSVNSSLARASHIKPQTSANLHGPLAFRALECLHRSLLPLKRTSPSALLIKGSLCWHFSRISKEPLQEVQTKWELPNRPNHQSDRSYIQLTAARDSRRLMGLDPNFRIDGFETECNTMKCMKDVPVRTKLVDVQVYIIIISGCQKHEFLCHNNQCIPRKLRCNRIEDCLDGSDEFNCSTDQYLCQIDNECLSLNSICNGIKDCSDGSDEYDCTSSKLYFIKVKGNCNKNQFECLNKKCIHSYKVCDGRNDCDDFSDEKDLKKCEKYGAICDDGTCAYADQICDDIFHCKDFSDERACTYLHILGKSRVFRDPNMSCLVACDNKCLHIDKICDHFTDCSNHLDEQDCGYAIPCPKNKNLACSNQKACYSSSEKCDGFKDCFDGSDEKYCKETVGMGLTKTKFAVIPHLKGSYINPKNIHLVNQEKGHVLVSWKVEKITTTSDDKTVVVDVITTDETNVFKGHKRCGRYFIVVTDESNNTLLYHTYKYYSYTPKHIPDRYVFQRNEGRLVWNMETIDCIPRIYYVW
ncbi:hypothetical protein RF11_01135 [Thelohanellus kitauei]|uniref:Uncharacterized protein n=1 Tax=Thelohanellus kitauei TaxID=669202 RepID=A0A0C2MBG0_THEKT|nr:hypothetical protein RF11_01135 [Thelohanellus kitauei]